MSASDALHPRLFHGAREGWVDTHVRPPSVTGQPAVSSAGYSSGSGRPPHTELAFATGNESSAWSYARVSSHHPDAPENNDPDPVHRSRVHEVAMPADGWRDGNGYSEVQSQSGFPILRTHMAAPGETGSFPQINWNAFKARPTGHSRLVSGEDYNHSYMQSQGPEPERGPTPPHDETADAATNKYRAPDGRHPGQLNLYSGKTVAEHQAYNDTPGFMLHMQPGQFDNVAFHRDPTTSTIRRSKPWHQNDVEFGTVHG